VSIAVPLWLLATLVLIILGLVLVLWSVKRRRQPHLELESEAGIEELARSIAGATMTTRTMGNQIEILQDGAFFDALFRDMQAARESINFETFLAKEGELTRRMSELLAVKAREGVEVRMLLDGSGGKHYGKDELRSLREAGVRIAKFHPIRVSNLGLINNRDHRKITVIDGRIGYTGGHCLVDNWLGEGQDREHFRDISVRVEGPVVAQLQSAFSENWSEETGEVVGGPQFFPELEPAGDATACAVWVSASGNPSSVKVLYYMAIHAAKRRITIQNPYFLPDPDAREALAEAVKRGVEVQVMIPATDASDAPWVQHASHHRYGMLLEAGVKLYDYHRTLLHQKVLVVDEIWVAVGSTNFDDRSFELNDEIALVIEDRDLARRFEEIFEEDMKHATAVDAAEWDRRPWRHKAIDFTMFLFNEQL
jgi:cardiolipin synthase A/B